MKFRGFAGYVAGVVTAAALGYLFFDAYAFFGGEEGKVSRLTIYTMLILVILVAVCVTRIIAHNIWFGRTLLTKLGMLMLLIGVAALFVYSIDPVRYGAEIMTFVAFLKEGWNDGFGS